MLKFILFAFVAAMFSMGASAEILKFVSGKDGRVYEARAGSGEYGDYVFLYRGDRLLGMYGGLIIDESSLSSDLVSVVGGEIALKIESNGSRSKYDVIVPIELANGKLNVECLYKSVYDSVDEIRSVGAICQRRELDQFDVPASINAGGLYIYTASHAWLKSLYLRSCVNAVGLEFGLYRVARCAGEGVSETSKQKIVVLNRQNRLIFSIVGYELIPLGRGTEFVLLANMKDEVVVFKGDFVCYEEGRLKRVGRCLDYKGWVR